MDTRGSPWSDSSCVEVQTWISRVLYGLTGALSTSTCFRSLTLFFPLKRETTSFGNDVWKHYDGQCPICQPERILCTAVWYLSPASAIVRRFQCNMRYSWTAICVTVHELHKIKTWIERSVRMMLIQEHVGNVVTLFYLNRSLKL